jgi:hypothetical protein
MVTPWLFSPLARAPQGRPETVLACLVRHRTGPAGAPPAGPRRRPAQAGPCGPGRCWSWPPRPRRRCGPGSVGIARKTGFGLVSPLPGIWPSLHVDTAITLPVGVEAYAAYALRAWLASEHAVSARTRRFARWSAICSFALGMAGQVAYHLLAQAGVTRVPWAITAIVSCLPVLVLGMGTAQGWAMRSFMRSPMIKAPSLRAGRPTATGTFVPGDPGAPGSRAPR